jgi:glutathionylspermidine synthase
MEISTHLHSSAPIGEEDFAALCLRAIFDVGKWDLESEGKTWLCDFSLRLAPATWSELAGAAENLAAEALAAEAELLEKPHLWRQLGLPLSLRWALERPIAATRLMRFDFHPTSSGFRISEGQIDEAAGILDAAGVSQLYASEEAQVAGDPAGTVARSLAQHASTVGFLHQARYAEDRQFGLYLRRRLAEHGVACHLIDAQQLRFDGDQPLARVGQRDVALDHIFRFYSAEWLPSLRWSTRWPRLNRVPLCNPLCAVLTQSKRFPLVWNQLQTALPTWQKYLPETVAIERMRLDDPDWVIKPALGHEGHGVSVMGATPATERAKTLRAAARHPNRFAAQRRFDPITISTPHGPRYPAIGIFVVDGKAAGAYGRVSSTPRIDSEAQEVPVLIQKPEVSDN